MEHSRNGRGVAGEFMKAKKGEVKRKIERNIFPNDKPDNKICRQTSDGY